MDAVRYFKTRAKAQMRDLSAAGQDPPTLQQVQHQVARSAGFRSWVDMVRADESAQQLAWVMDREPDLTRFGFGVFYRPRRTSQERQNELDAGRADLRAHADLVQQLSGWLHEHVAPRKTINRSFDSYNLKHIAEQDLGKYVTNGEIIAAAILAGYPYLRLPHGSPNASFGMSQHSMWALRPADRPPRRVPEEGSRLRLELRCCLCARQIGASKKYDVLVLDDEWARRFPRMIGRIACIDCAMGNATYWTCDAGVDAWVPGHIHRDSWPSGPDHDAWCHFRGEGTPRAVCRVFPEYAVLQGASEYLSQLLLSARALDPDSRTRIEKALADGI